MTQNFVKTHHHHSSLFNMKTMIINRGFCMLLLHLACNSSLQAVFLLATQNVRSHWNEPSLGPGNAALLNFRAWERRSHAFPPTLTPDSKEQLGATTEAVRCSLGRDEVVNSCLLNVCTGHKVSDGNTRHWERREAEPVALASEAWWWCSHVWAASQDFGGQNCRLENIQGKNEMWSFMKSL